MDEDKNLDQHSKNTEIKNSDGDYKTPLQTPSSVSATPVPRRFADFTFSSSDDSTLSSTPLDPKLVEELLGSTDSSGKSFNESLDTLNNAYSTLLSFDKGSGTESTLALLNETSNTAEISLAESCESEPERSKDDLNEAQLFNTSGEQVLVDFPKDVSKSQTIVRQLKDSVGDTVLRREDDRESNASSYTTSKDEEILETDLERYVLAQEHPFETPKGILGSFKELSETLPSRVELTKKSTFETSVGVNESFFNKPVVQNTFFRDLEGPKFNTESLSLVTSTEGGSSSGQRTDIYTENSSIEVNSDMLSSPNRNSLKADVSKIDGVRKILKDFFSFSKGKESSEKKLDDLQSIKPKRSGTDMVFISDSCKRSCIDTSHNLQTSSPSRTFKEPSWIPDSPSTGITDNNSNDRGNESSLENTQISNNEMETHSEKENETSDSLRRNVFYKLDAELAMDLDRDLILLDTSLDPKESGLEQNKSPGPPKITLPQNLTTSNIFALSFNAYDLKKEQKLKEDHEKKMIADIQELKSKRFQNTYHNNELSYAKILTEIKKEPIFEDTFEPEFKESSSDLEPRNTNELEGCKTMDFEASSLQDNPLCSSRGDMLKENFLKYADLKTDDGIMCHDQKPSFKVQQPDKTGDAHTTRAINEPNLFESEKTQTFLFSDPISTCMDNIKNRLCSREEDNLESPSKDREIDGVSSMKNIKETHELEMDDTFTKHTCEKYYNLSPRKVADGRLKKGPQENTKPNEFETDSCPMDVTTEEAYRGATRIQFDKSVARGVMRALTDMNSKRGVLLTQIQKFVVQQRLVRIDSKVDKEIERFMDTAEELGIVTKKGARFYPQIKASKASVSKIKKVESIKKEDSVKQKPAPKNKKVGVKVATPSSRRLEMYRQKAMNSPVPLLNLRTRRVVSSKEIVKEMREPKRKEVFKSLRSRVIMADLNSKKNI